LGVNGVIIRYTPQSHPCAPSNAVQYNKEWQACSYIYMLNSQRFDISQCEAMTDTLGPLQNVMLNDMQIDETSFFYKSPQ
jgi:hypothetical protein